MIFSKIGIPRGRGKIDRFFQNVNQLLLGYTKNRKSEILLTIQVLEQKIEEFLIYDYNHRIHTSTQKHLSISGTSLVFYHKYLKV